MRFASDRKTHMEARKYAYVHTVYGDTALRCGVPSPRGCPYGGAYVEYAVMYQYSTYPVHRVLRDVPDHGTVFCERRLVSPSSVCLLVNFNS